MTSKRNISRGDSERSSNYKALLTQYYDRDPQLRDVYGQINSITPEIELLDDLTAFDRQIDALIKNKRYDVQELYMRPAQKLKRLLRVHVVREEQAQPILKIFGALYPRREETAGIKFTSFFREISYVYERDKTVLENWKKPVTGFTERDGLVIKLPANERETIRLNLTQISNPPRFQVQGLLEKIVGMKTGTRVEILEAFWLYIKTNKLQDMQNKEVINSDDLLRQAFKVEKLTFATINNRVREMLVPVESISILVAAEDSHVSFDVVVEVEEKPNVDIVPFFSQKLNEEKNDHPFLSLMSRIKKFEGRFKENAEKLRRHLTKRNIYMNFTAEKIEQIIMEQHRLLRQLKKADPIEEHNRLQFLLENEDGMEKEIKHYFEQINNTVQSSRGD